MRGSWRRGGSKLGGVLFFAAMVVAQAQGGRALAQQAAGVGDVAPLFSLVDTAGTEHALALHRGKVVVLEWFCADCPIVKKYHEQHRTMAETAARYADRGVVWLAICSSAPGNLGGGRERNAQALEQYAIRYPLLLDPTGATGHAYGVACTPTMVVIDARGRIAYRGAMGSSRDLDVGTNLVAAALDAVLAGRAPEPAETRPYGCPVRY